jgi:hypothetical protein
MVLDSINIRNNGGRQPINQGPANSQPRQGVTLPNRR